MDGKMIFNQDTSCCPGEPNRNFSFSVASEKGLRSYQEDTFFGKMVSDGQWFGIFDGHGGDECSKECREALLGGKIDLEKIGEENSHFVKRMKEVFKQLNERTKHMSAGSTASLIFLSNTVGNGPTNGRSVVVGVMGDSPVVVQSSYTGLWTAPEHNVRTNHEEAQKACERGGWISQGYLFADLRSDGLQMARALGDRHLDKVLARWPDVTMIHNPKTILIASDGVVDPSHYEKDALQTVIDLVLDGAEAKQVVDRAVQLKTGDNATAIVIRVVD